MIYRMGNYRANCSAHYSKTKAQVADVCGMVIGATVMSVETTFAVPPGISVDPKSQTDPFLDSIRKTSTAFVTNGASFYLAVSGLGRSEHDCRGLAPSKVCAHLRPMAWKKACLPAISLRYV